MRLSVMKISRYWNQGLTFSAGFAISSMMRSMRLTRVESARQGIGIEAVLLVHGDDETTHRGGVERRRRGGAAGAQQDTQQ
jgi:hypothetical protein